MARYLTRIAHDGKLGPNDAKAIAQRIRLMLGSKEAIGNLRISNHVIEFDLFARDSGQLSSFTDSLEKEIGTIVTLKLLDQPLTETREKEEILREGIELFNEERFWECHEILERIWHPSKGEEREIIQGMILTAAALVHAQKDRNETALGMLRKAESKLGNAENYEGINLKQVKRRIDEMLEHRDPKPFKIKLQQHS